LSDIYELTPKAHAHKHKPTHTSIDTHGEPSNGERPTAQLPIAPTAQLVPPLVRGFAEKDLLIDSSGMADLWALPIRTRGERGNGVRVGGSNDALKPRAATPPPPSPPRHILPHAFKSGFRDKQGGGGVCVCVCVCVYKGIGGAHRCCLPMPYVLGYTCIMCVCVCVFVRACVCAGLGSAVSAVSVVRAVAARRPQSARQVELGSSTP